MKEMNIHREDFTIERFRLSDLDELDSLIVYTVKKSYPKYYSSDAIAFFLKYLNKLTIIEEQRDHPIFILRESGSIVGTATLIERHVKRLFIHPDCQGKGYGKLLMREIEKLAISKGVSFIELHSSLPAKKFYDDLGYSTFKPGEIPVDSGDSLKFYRMAKFLGNEQINVEFNLNGQHYSSTKETQLIGLKSIDADFQFYQQANLIFAEYNGKSIENGEAFGLAKTKNATLYFNHIAVDTGETIQGAFNVQIKDNQACSISLM